MTKPRLSTRRIVRYLLLLLVSCAALPFGSVPSGAMALLQVGIILPGLLALFLVYREPSILAGKANKLLAITGVIFLVGILQALPGFTMIGSKSPPDTLDGLARLGLYAIIGLTALAAFRRRPHFQTAAIWLAAIGSFESIYGSFEFLSGRQHIFAYEKIYYLDSATGTFINRSHFGIFLAICLPFALELLQTGAIPHRSRNWRERVVRFMEHGFIRRVLPALALFVIILGILLSFSRGAFAAALLAILVYLITKRASGIRRPVLVLMILIPVILLTWQSARAPGQRFIEDTENTYSVGGRLPAWKVGLGMVSDHPVFGTGFGTFEHAFPAYQPPEMLGYWDHLHNDFLQFLIEGGLVTFTLVLLFLVLLFYPVRIPKRDEQAPPPFRSSILAGLAAVLLHSLVDFPLRIPAIAILAAFLIGLHLASESYRERKGVTQFPDPSI